VSGRRRTIGVLGIDVATRRWHRDRCDGDVGGAEEGGVGAVCTLLMFKEPGPRDGDPSVRMMPGLSDCPALGATSSNPGGGGCAR